jgi:hypothetical protein
MFRSLDRVSIRNKKHIMRLRGCTILLILIIACSCNDKEEQKVNKVSSDFQIYVDSFVAEAKQRGIEASIKDLEVSFAKLTNNCGYGWSAPPKVNIDSACWAGLAYSEAAREILMFHELGHALLGRSHDDRTLPNGDYRSIMCQNIFGLYNFYVPAKRTYYLDELFTSSNKIPDWSLPKIKETVILRDLIQNNGQWVFKNNNATGQTGAVVDTVFSSPSNSLAIKSTQLSEGFSRWAYAWKPDNIEEGDNLLLKVKIRSKGLTGGGAFFAIRADTDKDVAFFYTTQGKTPALGDSDFQEYSIKVNYFPNSNPTLIIFLMLDGSSLGTVYFDDIEVIKYY